VVRSTGTCLVAWMHVVGRPTNLLENRLERIGETSPQPRSIPETSWATQRLGQVALQRRYRGQFAARITAYSLVASAVVGSSEYV
jgi:hypothetical protein